MEDVPPLFSELWSLEVWTFAESSAEGILVEDSEKEETITVQVSLLMFGGNKNNYIISSRNSSLTNSREIIHAHKFHKQLDYCYSIKYNCKN